MPPNYSAHGVHIDTLIYWVHYLMFVLFVGWGVYFIYTIGVLIGVGLGSTAIVIPVSVVSKHYPSSKRTIATGIVTATSYRGDGSLFSGFEENTFKDFGGNV